MCYGWAFSGSSVPLRLRNNKCAEKLQDGWVSSNPWGGDNHTVWIRFACLNSSPIQPGTKLIMQQMNFRVTQPCLTASIVNTVLNVHYVCSEEIYMHCDCDACSVD